MNYRETQSASRMFTGLMAVVAIHAVMIIAFKSGFMQELMPAVERITEVTLEKPEVLPPPPPRPSEHILETDHTNRLVIPVPDIPMLHSVDAMDFVAYDGTNVAEPVIDRPAGAGSQIMDFKVDSRYGLSKPHYPAAAIRGEQEGTVVLKIYVLENGRVGRAEVGRSSGYMLLDDSAIREALRSWRFTPRMVDGRPVASWGRFAVTFRLQDL